MQDFDLYKAPEQLLVHEFFQVNPVNNWSLLSFIDYVDDKSEFTRMVFYDSLKTLQKESIVPGQVKLKIGCLHKFHPDRDGSHNQYQIELSNTYESWKLIQLVRIDLAEGDYRNALELSRTLYLKNRTNPDYQYLYAIALYYCKLYNDSYTILEHSRFVPSLYLFAKSCLQIGFKKSSREQGRPFWCEGVQALLLALRFKEFPKKKKLTRLPDIMPSIPSIHKLILELYMVMGDMDKGVEYYEANIRHDSSS